MKTDKLISYLRTNLGLSVRALGFLGLTENNCRACSGYPDSIEPAKSDVGELVDRTDKLIQLLEER